jgi:Domain of unknown function (DUF3067)
VLRRKTQCMPHCCAVRLDDLTCALVFTRYDRSYDVTLVRREYMGKSIVAMNIMWAYAEQKSFQVRVVCLTERQAAVANCTHHIMMP